ncbi:MAG: M23 family metallopeptidase [Salinibacterium sp.]|nr:M23 family metallopeptidase [Salinibacterium sp.]
MGTTRFRRGATGSRLRINGVVALIAALIVAIAGTTIATSPAWADDYPTWADVSAARNNEAATAAAVAQIQGLLSGLQAEAERTQKDAEAKATIWQEADNKYQAANARAATLQEQADAASAKATASEQRAGQMAAQLMRAGGGDITTNLLLNSGDADNLLYGLGMSAKISEQANAIYERALVDKNTAQALTDQADVAKEELLVLKTASEKAFNEAKAAADAASVALSTQLDNQARLQAQLVVLQENRAATEADYIAGVRARISANASLDAGEISLSGWVKPAGGYITSVFGYSSDYGTKFHKGTDLGAGCNSNIYAAASGTVIFALYGWNGGYGNEVMIDHGGGIVTRYGHIVAGGILVSNGQSVGVGENIARVGSTGDSTGCHLHFEVIRDGVNIDPVPFMAGQGITLG